MKNNQTGIILQNIFHDMRKLYPNSYRKAYQTLVQRFLNIIRHPNEITYRKIDLSNQDIQKNLLIIPEMKTVLLNIGFSPNESQNRKFLIYRSSSLNIINHCISILNDILSQNPKSQITVKKSHIQKCGTYDKALHPKNISHKNQQNNHRNSKIYDENKNYNNISKINIGGIKISYFLYDLSNGMAKRLSKVLIGKEIEGIWHSSLCVYGNEYYYAGGINICLPRKTKFGAPIKEINFGYTNKSKLEFENYLRTIDNYYSPENYDLISHNCNHFSDAALYFLTGSHLPNIILKQHEEILKTPLGSKIRPLIEKYLGLRDTQKRNNPLSFISFLFGGILNDDENQNFKMKQNKCYQ